MHVIIQQTLTGHAIMTKLLMHANEHGDRDYCVHPLSRQKLQNLRNIEEIMGLPPNKKGSSSSCDQFGAKTLA